MSPILDCGNGLTGVWDVRPCSRVAGGCRVAMCPQFYTQKVETRFLRNVRYQLTDSAKSHRRG